MSDFIDFAEREMSAKLDTKVTIGITHDSEWDKAPEWAKWKAQSADGTWEWFSTKPKAYDFGLYVRGTFMPSGKGKKEVIGRGESTHYITRPNPNWRKSITKRPPKCKLPGHDEMMAGLNSLNIRTTTQEGGE